MKKLLPLVSLCLTLANLATSQSVGDIAIIGINSDNPDQFTFVVINDLAGSTTITFTDSGVNSSGNLRGNEGAVIYETPGTGLSAGTVVSITVNSGNNSSFSASASIGNISNGNDSNVGNNGFNLSASGDQVIAFTGSSASPNFIAAAQTNSNQFQSGSNDSNQSDLPPGLTVGTTAVAVGAGSGAESEFDNSEYTGPRGNFENNTIALTTINDNSNWSGTDSPITLNTTDFSPLLPVTLVNFSASEARNSISLQWQTASEQNNAFFSIQKSINGLNFEQIGRVKGAGTTTTPQSYSFVDTNPLNGINYYRLRQVDLDGTETIHQTIVVDFEGSVENQLKVFPTSSNNAINVQLNHTGEKAALINIFNLAGQLIYTDQFEQGVLTKSIDITNFVQGQYILTITTNSGVEMGRFIRQ